MNTTALSSKLSLATLAAKALSELGPTDSKWRKLARPEQLPPDSDWLIWLILAGRGWGKTRTGAEYLHELAMAEPGARLHIVARTAADVRDVCIEGESGLHTLYPETDWQPSRRRLVWPNGSQAICFSADKPDQLRGPQCSGAWADELAAWQYPEAWDQLRFGLRLGQHPRVVVTTTPRPIPLVRQLVKDSDDGTVAITRGKTWDNADNLAPAFIAALKAKYAGTRLGMQELDGLVIEDAEGALWSRDTLERCRQSIAPDCVRVVVGVDPAITATKKSDETGIIVAGIDAKQQAHVLADYSGRYSPDRWAQKVAWAYEHHQADRVVAEVNQGGDMVQAVLSKAAPGMSYKGVRASKGKRTRAEPIAALYEQGKVSHCGVFAELEDQLCTWEAMANEPSPDRLDALVWALTELTAPYQRRAYARLGGLGGSKRRM